MSNFISTVTRNALFFFSSQIWEGIAATATIAILARYLGLAGFGSYAVVFSIVNLTVPLTFMGIQEIGIREIATKSSTAEKGLYLGYLLQARLILLAIAGLIIALMLAVMRPEIKVIYATLIFYSAIVIGSSGELVASAFIAGERFEFNLLVLVIERLSLLFLIGLVALFDLGFYAVFFGYVISKSVKTFMAGYFLKKHFYPISFHYNLSWLKKIIKESYLIGFGISIGLGFHHAVVLLLKMAATTEAAGIFSAYYNLILRCQMASTSLSKSLMPRISIEAKRNTAAYSRLTLRGMTLLFAAGAAGALVIWPLKSFIIRFIYGAPFLIEIRGFGYLVLMLPFLFTDNILNVAIISKRLAKEFFLSKLAGFCTGLIHVLLMVSNYAVYAGIFGIIQGKLVSSLLMMIVFRKIARYSYKPVNKTATERKCSRGHDPQIFRE